MELLVVITILSWSHVWNYSIGALSIESSSMDLLHLKNLSHSMDYGPFFCVPFGYMVPLSRSISTQTTSIGKNKKIR